MSTELATRMMTIQNAPWLETDQSCAICGDTGALALMVPADAPGTPAGAPKWAEANWTKRMEWDDEFACIPGPLACRHDGMITEGAVIRGAGVTVTIDGTVLEAERSLELCDHSPSGFAWGYAGSGPAQLALALLLEAGASDREAMRWHQDFKFEFVDKGDWNTEFLMIGDVIIEWLTRMRTEWKIR